MKYAFLTTYEETIFLKQELPRDGTWTLFFSGPISHKHGVPVGKSHPEPQLSLRRCMLWLCIVTSGGPENYLANNSTPIKNWVRDGTKEHSHLFSPCRESLKTDRMHATPLAEKSAPGFSSIVHQRDHSDPVGPLDTPSHVPGRSHAMLVSRGKSRGSQSSHDPDSEGSQNSQGRHRISQPQQDISFQQKLQSTRDPRQPRSIGQSHGHTQRERSQDLRSSSREPREQREPRSLGQHYDVPTRQKPQDPRAQREPSPVQLDTRRRGGLERHIQ